MFRAISAAMDLALCFPPQKGFRGACTTLADASRYFRHGLGYPSKYSAVRLIVRRNMEHAEACGHGNRAVRRAKALAYGKACRNGTAPQDANNPAFIRHCAPQPQ